MNVDANKESERARGQERLRTMTLSLFIVIGFAAVFGLSRWMDARRPPVDARIEEERLYLTGQTVKRMSLGFNGLVADWYWMRSLQYVGNKVINYQGELQLDDLSPLDLRLLYPLLDTATTLDPQMMVAYYYGAIVLPAINEEHAIKLIEKGIEQNKDTWRLHQHLGYIYWKRGDYQKASAVYSEGAKIADAPAWMREMSARMAAEGGSHQMAREVYTHLYQQAEDEQVKKVLVRRLMQVDSFEEREAIRVALGNFQKRNGRCAETWKEALADLRAARLPDGKPLRLDAAAAPLDPSDTAYLLDKGGCEVKLDFKSKVPYQ